jgi:hypothetical protein
LQTPVAEHDWLQQDERSDRLSTLSPDGTQETQALVVVSQTLPPEQAAFELQDVAQALLLAQA